MFVIKENLLKFGVFFALSRRFLGSKTAF